MKRLAFMMTHPTQYHSPWFRALAARSDISIHVFYGALPTAAQQGDGFGVTFEWDTPLLEGYEYTVLRNVGSGSISTFSGIDTPDVGRAVAEGDFDAWIINGWRTRSEWRTIEACHERGVPMFIRGDSTLLTRRSVPKRVVKHLLYRRWVPRFACYLTVGSLNERYYRHYGANPERFVPVRHFVDNEWFGSQADARRVASRTTRALWRVPDSSLMLLFAGKFTGDKQPLDAIRAVERARQDGSDIHLVMVGDGPLRAECERYCVDRNLPVTFAGFLNQGEMPTAYAAADVLVMSSVSETWGLVVNEAMASGLPAIVSDMVGCAPDLVIRNETGSIFPAGNFDMLATIIRDYAANRMKVEKAGIAARALVQSYSLESAVSGTVAAAERFAR
jgi:glycosyltransferase involved in cell wall biosynthesis